MRRFWSCLFVLGLLVVAAAPSASAAVFVVTNTNDSGPGSLRGAIQAARDAPGADTITFDLTGCPCVITLTSGLVSILDPVTIEGPGADLLAVSGNDSSRIFHVTSTQPVTIDGLTLRDGSATLGGAVSNAGGTLTIANSTLTDNTASGSGGAVENSGGTLTVTDSTISGNTSGLNGGAIASVSTQFVVPTVTVVDSTLSGNHGDRGGAIASDSGTLAITGSTLSGNTAALDGGAIHARRGTVGGNTTITSSTMSGNEAGQSGGAILSAFGTMTIANSTISGNTSDFRGGGVYAQLGSLTFLNSTVTDNTARVGGGGVYVEPPGSTGGTTLGSSLVAANTAPSGPDVSGPVIDGGYNLVGTGAGSSGVTDGVNGNMVGTEADPIDPLVGPLADNGAPTRTHALLDGSRATDHVPESTNGCGVGAPASAGRRDQRGVFRPQGAECDVGAFERENPSPTVIVTEPADGAVLLAGRIPLAAVFSDPDAGDTHTCRLVISDDDESTPDIALTGVVTEPGAEPGSCTAEPALGAGLYRLTATVTDGAGEQDSDTVTFGVYDPAVGFVVTNTDDSGFGSLRAAVQATNDSPGADTITFDLPGCPCVITLTSGSVGILGPVTIAGPGAPLLAISGNQSFRMLDVSSTEPVAIDGLTLRDGSTAGGGGAISNSGTLAVSNSTLSGNSSGSGSGAISNSGTLTVTDSTLSGNNTTFGDAGAIGNSGTLTVTNSALSGNFTTFGTTFTAGAVSNSGTLTVTNSTISGNSANVGGIRNGGTLTVTNSTLTGNRGGNRGSAGGIHNSGALTLRNSLVAGNPTTAPAGKDVFGPVTDGGYNLVGDGTGSSGLTDGQNGNRVGTGSEPIDPLLGPLADNGGATETHALLAGSPAIDHIPAASNGCGDPIAGDQRGVARPQGTGCDIGAYELLQNRAPAVTIAQPADNAVLAAGSIALAAAFTDPDPGDIHTCELALSDGDDATPDLALAGAVAEPATEPGSCTATQELGAGVYTLTATVTDGAGASGSATTLFVVYDPSAGFVTGGGWITSHPGDCTLDPDCAAAAGKATFAFVTRYKEGASIPTGSTRLRLRAGGLTFHSESYDWLIVDRSGTNAQYRGTGTVNGGNDPDGNPYKFMVWARDGADDDTPDTFRIKIWFEHLDPDTNQPVENVVYDNAAATIPDDIAAGSIAVKTK